MARLLLGDALQELSDLGGLLAQRRQSGSSEDVCQKLLEVGLQKLRAPSPLKVADSKDVYSMVEKAGFAEKEKAALPRAVDEAALAVPAQALPQEGGQLRPQLLSTPQNYLTASEWAVLEKAEASYDEKSRCLATCLRRVGVGVESLAEQTVGYCVALLLTFLPKLPSYP